jgi:protein-tyrosine phosphatase
VCLGNICRSPMAEAVMRQLVADAGLAGAIELDSAGTSRYHIGDRPDPRALAEAARRGVPVGHRARQLTAEELPRWDLVVGMDRQNVRDVRALAAGLALPEAGRIELLRSFEDHAARGGDLDVPDPYYGEAEDFAAMFDLIESACRALLAHLTVESIAGAGPSAAIALDQRSDLW